MKILILTIILATNILAQEPLELEIAKAPAIAQILEDVGEYRHAMDLYDIISKHPNGNTSHYRAAVLYCKIASKAWKERKSSDALNLFLAARQRIDLARELPAEIAPEKREELVKYLDQSINFLQAAKIEPADKVVF